MLRKSVDVTAPLCRLSGLLSVLLLVSCATLSPSGVGRIKEYTVVNGQLPLEFDGYSIAFVSDLHYPSKFTKKRLHRLVDALQHLSPDAIMLGGDYVTSNDYIAELFSSISSVKTVNGTYAVLGNHERKNKELIAREMRRCGIVLLSDSVAVIEREGSKIFFAGVYDSFEYNAEVVQPAETVPDSLFTVLLCHTPDYAERSSTTADLVLSGHTHGGQVSLLGLYTPVRNSVYGTKFLRGMNNTTAGSTVITTNGVGTSRKKIRFCVPSEIVVVRLKRE